MLWNPAQVRVVRAKRKKYFSYPAGQGVWDLTHERSVKDVMYQLQLEYAEAMERVTAPDDPLTVGSKIRRQTVRELDATRALFWRDA